MVSGEQVAPLRIFCGCLSIQTYNTTMLYLLSIIRAKGCWGVDCVDTCGRPLRGRAGTLTDAAHFTAERIMAASFLYLQL